MQRFCTCRQCQKQRRRGRVLGARLLRHFGDAAYYVSDYVKYRKFLSGRARKDKVVEAKLYLS